MLLLLGNLRFELQHALLDRGTLAWSRAGRVKDWSGIPFWRQNYILYYII
jgi:hypothetical protein